MSEGWRISANWRLETARYRLVGETCPHCTGKIFPPRDICPDCLGLTVKKETKPVSGRILFAGKPDKDKKRILMVRLNDGRVGFGEINGEIQNLMTSDQLMKESVVWQPRSNREFAAADNRFELLPVVLMGLINDSEK